MSVRPGKRAGGHSKDNVTSCILGVKCYVADDLRQEHRPVPATCYGEPMRWLTLRIGLPASPTRHRVAAWRKLR
jgi:hypothetical protein